MSHIFERAAHLRACPDVPGLPERYQKDLKKLFAYWNSKRARNIMRTKYYNGVEKAKNLGIAVPDEYADLNVSCGWPALAVNTLAAISQFDAYYGSETAMSILDEVTFKNDFYRNYDMLLTDELIHSVAAVTVTRGADGVPALHTHSALTAVMLWDGTKNRVRCGVTVARVDDKNAPIAYNLYEDDCIVYIYLVDGNEWRFTVYQHAMNRPLIEPFIYRASKNRPFGSSRITKEVMSITDRAMRTSLRAEIGAELFTSPQKVLLGVNDDAIGGEIEEEYEPDDEGAEYDEFGGSGPEQVASPHVESGWPYLMGHVVTVPLTENGSIPNFVNVTGASMEPHFGYMRSLAAQFAAATSIPLNELGIVQDNPASAEAIDAARAPLIREANRLNRDNGRALINVGLMSVAIALNKPLDALTDDERDIGAHFMDPDRPSMVSRSDALSKLAAAAPGFAQTRVFWEKAGLTDDQIEIVMAVQRQQANKDGFAALLAGVANVKSE